MTHLTPELTLLGWSVGVLLLYIAVQGGTAMREQGPAFNAGPRDDPKPLGAVAGRARRALENFKETYPVFIALTLALAVAGRAGGIADTGAWIWFIARIVYLPLYVFGVPWVRTLAWGTAAVGLTMMLVRLLAGG